jgi:hypothetical protein
MTDQTARLGTHSLTAEPSGFGSISNRVPRRPNQAQYQNQDYVLQRTRTMCIYSILRRALCGFMPKVITILRVYNM